MKYRSKSKNAQIIYLCQRSKGKDKNNLDDKTSSAEFCKTKTTVITMTNYNSCKKRNKFKPTRMQSKYM